MPDAVFPRPVAAKLGSPVQVRQQRHLVLFVKAPRLGAVKTRLSADIGALQAWRFYRSSVAGILRRLGRDRRWLCRLWVTPDRFALSGGPWPTGYGRRAQGSGDLGERMARALATMPPGPVVIIGGDIPDIECGDIARAFRALERRDMVFGPASDGGYWLVGVRHPGRRADLFAGVRWSSEFALADSLANLADRRPAAMLETLDDIDDGDDLARWISRPGVN